MTNPITTAHIGITGADGLTSKDPAVRNPPQFSPMANDVSMMPAMTAHRI